MLLYVTFKFRPYTQEHPRLSYKQGMHELLGPLVYVLFTATEISSYVRPSSLLMTRFRRQDEYILSSREHIEHDAYYLFEKVMEHTGCWFLTKPEKIIEGDRRIRKEVCAVSELCTYLLQRTPLEEKCHYIYHELLKFYDMELYTLLCSLDVEPQIYLLYVMRFLFFTQLSKDDGFVVCLDTTLLSRKRLYYGMPYLRTTKHSLWSIT